MPTRIITADKNYNKKGFFTHNKKKCLKDK